MFGSINLEISVLKYWIKVVRWSVNKLSGVTGRRILRMLIAWEVCQWTVCTPKRWASILLDMSMSWNVTIMYLLTHSANKLRQVVEFSSPLSFQFLSEIIICSFFVVFVIRCLIIAI